MSDNVSQKIRKVIAQECGLTNVSNETKFMTRQGPDYFDCIGVLYTLQHMLHVQLPESKYQKYETVGGLTKDIIHQMRTNRAK